MLTNSSLTIFRDKSPSFVPHIIMHLFLIVLRDVGINISPCIAMVENLIVVLKNFAIITPLHLELLWGQTVGIA